MSTYKITQKRFYPTKIVTGEVEEEEVKKLGFWSEEIEINGADVFDGYHSFTTVEREVAADMIPFVSDEELYRLLGTTKREENSNYEHVKREVLKRGRVQA